MKNPTVTITIARALRVKNSLVKEITELNTLIQSSNQVVVESLESSPAFQFSIEELLLRRSKLMTKLVELKVLLDTASQPIRGVIYLLSEKKSLIKTLRTIPTNTGLTVDYRGTSIIYRCQLLQSEVIQDIKLEEKAIEALQDEIAEFNSRTKIAYEVEDID